MRLHGNRKQMYLQSKQRLGGRNFHFNEGGDGGGGGGGGDATFSQADVDAAVSAAVSKAVDEATTGLKSKNSELLTSLRTANEAAKQWEGLDAEKVKGMMSHFENDQDLKDIAEGKHEDVIQRRLEKVTAGYDTKIAGLETTNTELTDKLTAANEKIRDLVIDSSVVSAFVQEKGLEGAIPDVVLRAKGIFQVEDGQAVARDADGKLMTGKDGPLTVQEWAVSLKETAPHLFPGSDGSGSKGGGKGGEGGLESQMQEALKNGDQAEFVRLRKKQMAAKK